MNRFWRVNDSKVITVGYQGRSNITNAWRAVDYLDRMDLLDVDKSADCAGMEFFTNESLDILDDNIESDFIVPLNAVNEISEKKYITI